MNALNTVAVAVNFSARSDTASHTVSIDQIVKLLHVA